MSTNNTTQKKTVPFGGILLILGGLFMLMQQFIEIEITGGIFFGVLGLIFILWGATQRKSGLLIPGGILTGMSLGVFLIEDSTALAEYYHGGTFLISLGLGFALIPLLSRLFTEDRHWWALIVTAGLTLVGSGVIIMEMPDAGNLKPIVESIFNTSQYLWPIGLMVLGLWIIFKKKEA